MSITNHMSTAARSLLVRSPRVHAAVTSAQRHIGRGVDRLAKSQARTAVFSFIGGMTVETTIHAFNKAYPDSLIDQLVAVGLIAVGSMVAADPEGRWRKTLYAGLTVGVLGGIVCNESGNIEILWRPPIGIQVQSNQSRDTQAATRPPMPFDAPFKVIRAG